MNNRPTSVRVFGSSLVADPYAPAFRSYVYRGDRPITADREVAQDKRSAPPCAADGCAGKSHAKGYCPKHYYAHYRKRKSASAATPTASEPLTKE